jgi:hypothetical protein
MEPKVARIFKETRMWDLSNLPPVWVGLDQKQREQELLRERDSTHANNNKNLSTTTEIDVLAIGCRVIDWHQPLCEAESPARTTTARADWPAFAPRLSLDRPARQKEFWEGPNKLNSQMKPPHSIPNH